MKHIITTDNEDQGWLNSFNSYFDKDYKMGQAIEEGEIEELKRRIYYFNNELACGNAIRLIEQEG